MPGAAQAAVAASVEPPMYKPQVHDAFAQD